MEQGFGEREGMGGGREEGGRWRWETVEEKGVRQKRGEVGENK